MMNAKWLQKLQASAPSRLSNGVSPTSIVRSPKPIGFCVAPLVARAGEGFVLQVGDSITIIPSQIHHAKAIGDPAWIEVLCDPAWRADDHFVLC
jgi:hypothetical protein